MRTRVWTALDVLVAVAALVGAAILAISPAPAADLGTTGKITSWQPTTADPADWKPNNWYAGALLGHASSPDVDQLDDRWSGAAVAGYLWRPSSMWGVGAEMDYTLRDLGDISWDNGVVSLRGRGGVFVTPGTFVYGTLGVAEATSSLREHCEDLSKGLVLGGGVEMDVTKITAVRAEILHYRHSDQLIGWGDAGDTQLRAGVLFKF